MNKSKGISLIVLIVTIIVVIILAAVVVLTLSKNNPIESAKKATYMQDVNNIQDSINMLFSKKRESEYLSGKLSDFEIDEKLIQKYNDVLYVKNNKVCLDYIATIENGKVYKSYSKMVDNLKDNLEICYDGLKACNKVENPYFNDEINGYTITYNNVGIKIEVKNDNNNKYLHITLLDNGKTGYIDTKIEANAYNDKIYTNIKYRNSYNESNENNKINSAIIRTKTAKGYANLLLSSQNYINSYNNGWQVTSDIRTVMENYETLITTLRIGGNEAQSSSQDYTIDIDDVYMINLTEIFGAGNEPSKAEMDAIFEKFV